MVPALGGNGKSEGKEVVVGWGLGVEVDWALRELRNDTWTGIHAVVARERRGNPTVSGDALGLGTHLRLLLREARLGGDEAQCGGVGMLVDLVEVVFQDLHLVLRGAGRGLR